MESSMKVVPNVTKTDLARQFGIAGFTLIELSIVLVIIGLIVGGILVGQDLIRTAGARAQIMQIEKYNQASNTFRGKYGYLPGDIPNPYATQFGFAARGSNPWNGNGDGMLNGTDSGWAFGWSGCSEPLMFWVDLSQAKLIDGNFSGLTPTSWPSSDATGSSIDLYLPKSKMNDALHVYALNGGLNRAGFYNLNPFFAGNNFFAISQVTSIAFASDECQYEGNAGIPVGTAYNIDKKIDDGLPISGNVIAAAHFQGDDNVAWANQDLSIVNSGTTVPGSSAIASSSTTCYDNNNNSANKVNYSVSQNGGNNPTCALSLKFQ